MSNIESLRKNIPLSYYENKVRLMLKPFKLETGAFYVWLNAFEYVAKCCKVPDNTMLELFINMVDNDVHERMRIPFFHINFITLSYDQIIQMYHCFFQSLRNEIDLYRKRFSCRNQYHRETITEYVDSLCKIYDKCGYASHEKSMLRKKFIDGIRDPEIRSYLIRNTLLTFDDTVAMAKELTKRKLDFQIRIKAKIDYHTLNKQ
ncbi:hypothetical protein M0804_013250 [Polistes exclamans]|nr:hypothetical protein M0804_013250 [Polistes exclamans]